MNDNELLDVQNRDELLDEHPDIVDGEIVNESSVSMKEIEALAVEVIPMRKIVVEESNMASDIYQSLFEEDLGEQPRAKRAFKDFAMMGTGRSLKRLAEAYIHPEHDDWTNNFESVLRQLKDYSRKYQWQRRVRMVVTRASAEILAAAQRDAYVHAKDRIALARQLQDAGRTILELANLHKLTQDEAREMVLKGAATKLVQTGAAAERAEQGDILAAIRPEKEVSQMTSEELDQYAGTLQKALFSNSKS